MAPRLFMRRGALFKNEVQYMTIKECFDFVDEVKPNYFSNERKLQWINEVEGLVQTKVLLIAPEDVISYTIDGIDTKLMFALPPHDNIYPAYLSAMIDFWNGEYDRYANTKRMFDERFSEYSRFIAAAYRPALKWRHINR